MSQWLTCSDSGKSTETGEGALKEGRRPCDFLRDPDFLTQKNNYK